MKMKSYVYMDETPGAAGGGAAVVVDPGAVATPAAATTEPQGSALSVANTPEWAPATVPEKYRVIGEDGELDVTATFRKVDEHRTALEKRMGEGGIRPKTAEEYKLPESDAIKGLGLDDVSTKDFRDKAFGWGLNQAQYEAVMGEYATLAPALVNGAAQDTVATTVETLKGVFKDDYSAQMAGAFKAVSAVAQKAGLSYEEVDSAIGNNPVAIRLFAALSAEMGEDRSPAAASGSLGGHAETYNSYIGENWAAYSNPRDPKHAATVARAQQLSAREAKTA